MGMFLVRNQLVLLICCLSVLFIFVVYQCCLYLLFRSRIERELTGELGNVVLDISGVNYLDRKGASLASWLEGVLHAKGLRLGVVVHPGQSELLAVESELFPTYTDALLLIDTQNLEPASVEICKL